MRTLAFLTILLGICYSTYAFKYSEIFSDNFNETSGKVGSLLSKWELVTDAKHTHGQLNQYSNDEVYIKYGYLYVRAQQRQVKGFNYTSGKVNLGKKVLFTYGDVEVRVRGARGRGLSSIVSLTSGN
jgi:beta-glucanase (GH16 family)